MKIVLTGSPSHARKFRETALAGSGWGVHAFDLRGLRRRPVRLLKFLWLLRSADCWYHIGGHTIPLFQSLRLLQIARLFGTPVIIRWIGSDILTMGDYFLKRPKALSAAKGQTHWVGAPWLVGELAAMGLKADLVCSTDLRRTEFLKIEPPPLPAKFTVLAYLPDSNPTFYGAPLIERLLQDFPAVDFVIVGSLSKEKLDDRPNLRRLGHVEDMLSIYQDSTLLVRMTQHDGYSHMVQEALLLGRYVVWTYPFPGAFCAKDYDELHAHLERLLESHRTGQLGANIDGRRYIAAEHNPESLISVMHQKIASAALKESSQAR